MKSSKRISLESEVFSRGVDTIIGGSALTKAFESGKSLRIKLGIDATAPFLHIGHATVLWKIRALQEAGHKAVILLGDFTTRIGDPTGRSKTRPTLSSKEIEKNAKDIRRQLDLVLLKSPKVLEIRGNAEWYGKMRVDEFLRITSLITHAHLIGRDMFQERIKNGNEIFVHEFLYPILQGYDSVMLKSDLTIIGSDQLFNEHMGRALQEKFGQSPQAIVTLKLLSGLDGKEKMSKSAGNFITVNDSPREKFGKAMSLSDTVILDYLTICTDVSLEIVADWKRRLDNGENPMNAKLFFAEMLVERYHGPEIAQKACEEFLSVFSKKEMPEDIPILDISHGEYSLLNLVMETKAVQSKSEARRLILQRAVEIDGKRIVAPNLKVSVQKGMVIRIGKKIIYRVK